MKQPEINKEAQDDFESAVMVIKVISEVVSKMVSKKVVDVGLDLLLTAVNTLQPPVRALVKSQRLHVWFKGVAGSKPLR